MRTNLLIASSLLLCSTLVPIDLRLHAQTVPPVGPPPITSQTPAQTESSTPAAPISKDELKAQRKQQKTREKAASAAAKSQKSQADASKAAAKAASEQAKADKQADKAKNAQEKAIAPQQ